VSESEANGIVLVGYATHSGSTRGIAERIAATLALHGIAADNRSLHEVKSVAAYSAFVLGSPVYDGSWMPSAIDFIHHHRTALEARPVWLFSVGAFADTHRLVGRLMRREPREIHSLMKIVQPRDYRVFAGVIDPEHWSVAGHLMLHVLGGHCGDNRDWQAIDAWADTIARALPPRLAAA
jgi:menaquinone-dependent protoporphyrinogen oxidase